MIKVTVNYALTHLMINFRMKGLDALFNDLGRKDIRAE
jgi:hypothetical protein